MSLKAFHLFTVAAAILATSAYGMGSIVSALRDGAGNLALGLFSLAAGTALIIHGVLFYKQCEKEPWL